MKNPLPIPTEEDWRSEVHVSDDGQAHWNLDQKSAYETFNGKSHAEAFALFVENALKYQEDVFWAPNRCFGYYVLAYIHYLDSELSKGDADGANAFFGIVEFRSDWIRRERPEIREEIIRSLRRVADRQDWYDANPDLYGDFAAESQHCLVLIGAA